MDAIKTRVGCGFDVHKFTNKKKSFIIGGVCIPYSKGIIAHSDGDVLLHAIIDALLGASAFGDIGQLFPNTDYRYKNFNSRSLLKIVWKKISKRGYYFCNLDTTIVVQFPKISSYLPMIRKNIASDLMCHINCISVKATTTEKLGFIGRNEGIACKAVVLLNHKNYSFKNFK